MVLREISITKVKKFKCSKKFWWIFKIRNIFGQAFCHLFRELVEEGYASVLFITVVWVLWLLKPCRSSCCVGCVLLGGLHRTSEEPVQTSLASGKTSLEDCDRWFEGLLRGPFPLTHFHFTDFLYKRKVSECCEGKLIATS